jgi:hypothetical protein
MKATRLGSAALLGLMVAAAPAGAHHSFAAEYDANKPVKVTGVVTAMKWTNPHAWLYIDGKGPDGKVASWAFELTGVNALYRQGWRKEDLKVGIELTVDAYLSKTDPHMANGQTVTYQDGRRLFSGVPPPKGDKTP